MYYEYMSKKLFSFILTVTFFTYLYTLSNISFSEDNAIPTGEGNTTTNRFRLRNADSTETQNLKGKVKEERTTIIANRCEIITKNIDNRLARFNDNKNGHAIRYQELKTRLTNLISRLEQKGYDVSKLEADLTVLDTKIKKFADDYVTFIEQLKTTKGFACGQSQGAFADALSKAKDLLRLVRQDAMDIRDYYQTQIKPDLMALRAQKPLPTETPSEGN